ncbi:molybdopterin-dependent oxidoreductase-like protein [Mucilaginibacter gracilis]|uniref:Molybdopterin-dependent oxidoreductase-like protein n=1 Tax=Mucilaginibacter gracilis TaxID=423350 RepID=A0A495J7G0_9SPHI|nr:molybdopterin-dependent oxidoreductase [Mucilaginibacter gracilis]RKR83949.1 molybdopterin-dependent oxidoreductase-like protein [Mucilaginibacter gracilis]
MKKIQTLLLSALFALLLNPAFTSAQTGSKQATVKVSGEVSAPLDIKLSDMAQFEQTKVNRKDRDGKERVYSGVMLSAILQKAGVTMGKDLKGENLTKYVSVEASDGYQVIFALVELDKDFTDRQIILADEVDGKPLPEGDGQFRIIVQDEKKPARCIKMVTAITIKFAK